MATRSRRSALPRAVGNDDASVNSPKNVASIRTHRRSSCVNGVMPSTKQTSPSKVFDELFEENQIDEHERAKKENTSKKKLSHKEIFALIDPPDEKSDNGAKEKTKSRMKANETPRKTRCTVGNINYNEDVLMDKHEKKCIDIINLATPSKNHKNNKSQVTNQVAESSPRKRTQPNTEHPQPQQYDDENEMYQANQISSPPKRSKSEIELEQTPKKNSQLKSLQLSLRSPVKRKSSAEPENVHSNSKINTRKSTRCKSVGAYSEYVSSDDNTPKKLEAKVVLQKVDKTDTRKSNKQIAKNTRTSESAESEIENKRPNANKNSTPRTTRSRSISIQEPMKNLEEQTYSPTKHMQKLNISPNEGTPTRSGRAPIKLIINKRLLPSTPRTTPKTNTEKRDNTQRTSRRLCAPKTFPCLKDSEDESGDSSDDFRREGETSSSDEENMESGNDSAEEFQELNRRRNVKSKKKVPATPKTHKRVSKIISMDTPTKAISRMSIGTPTMDKHKRTTSVNKPSTPLQKARATLHVSVLPKSLPCREEQFNDIYSFLHARLSDGSGGCIYISGVPGTGKTATVSEVICCLRKSMTKGELSDFDYVEINGMKLSEPRQAYVQIWRQMTGETKTWEESHKLLQNKFTHPNSKRKMTLLLVDELDLLCTKRQDVVYNLLDWPGKTNAKLVVVTIANTMDLPERILMGKVTSRLGLTRLTFPPYNFKQLEEIVVSRLKGANAFGGETIQLVARKVAAVSGDARRALDICRRSAEIAEKNDRQQVSMVDVKQALDEMIASPKIQAIKHCSDMEKYFLQAVCTEVQRTGLEEVVFKNVYMQMETLCSLDGLKASNVSEALEICARLGSYRLLLCDHSRMDIHQRLLLNVSTDDVYFATKEI